MFLRATWPSALLVAALVIAGGGLVWARFARPRNSVSSAPVRATQPGTAPPLDLAAPQQTAKATFAMG